MIEGLLVDVDGTLLDGGLPVSGAAAALAALRSRGLPLLFATNTSRVSRAEVARSLVDAGIEAAPAEILSASAAAAERLAEDGVKRILPLLTPNALADFAAFEIAGDRADAVVVGDMGALFTFDVLNEAFLALRSGARFIACHKNRYWKSPRGLRLDAGAFVAALEYGADAHAEVVGKPERAYFRAAERLLHRPAARLALAGDSLTNDVAGGRAAGLTTILVRTGLYDERTLRETEVAARPDHVVDSIAHVADLLATL